MRFDENKTIALIYRILSQLTYLPSMKRLMFYMYVCDREMLVRNESTITRDTYVFLDGYVFLKNTYVILNTLSVFEKFDLEENLDIKCNEIHILREFKQKNFLNDYEEYIIDLQTKLYRRFTEHMITNKKKFPEYPFISGYEYNFMVDLSIYDLLYQLRKTPEEATIILDKIEEL